MTTNKTTSARAIHAIPMRSCVEDDSHVRLSHTALSTQWSREQKQMINKVGKTVGVANVPTQRHYGISASRPFQDTSFSSWHVVCWNLMMRSWRSDMNPTTSERCWCGTNVAVHQSRVVWFSRTGSLRQLPRTYLCYENTLADISSRPSNGSLEYR